MARPRKQTYTLDMYLNKNIDGDILNDADTQRKPAWKAIVNGLIVTILTDDYIPPIILAEEDNSQLHISDGGSRTAALMMYRHGNYKISSSVEEAIIPYKKKVINENGDVVWEDAYFNIKGKTYEQLPDELKKRFNEYQIETVVHEHCDKNRIATYIKRYNEHSSMNTNQKAFTYVDKFAGRIRKIMESNFFVNCNVYSDNDNEKGAIERIIVETVMCTNHFDGWSKQAKNLFKYVNDHSTDKEFDILEDHIFRLGNIITEEIKDIFNKTDSFIFLTLFNRFAELGVHDAQFACFLKKFKAVYRDTRTNEKGLLFDEIKQNSSTKDKQVITDKLELLENLMFEFLQNNAPQSEYKSAEEFIAECIDTDMESIHENMDFYEESLDKLMENTIRYGSKLWNSENRFSLLAMMAYSDKKDLDLDEWMEGYAKQNTTYLSDQKQNFLHMKTDFMQFCREAQRIKDERMNND